MGFQVLASTALAVHFAYLAYVVSGGFLAWRWPRTVWVHLVAAGWGLAVITVPLDCPLTALEDWARRRAGQGPLDRGFIDRYIEGVLYPQRYVHVMQGLAVAVIAVSYLGIYRRWRVRRAVGPAPRPAPRSPRSRSG